MNLTTTQIIKAINAESNAEDALVTSVCTDTRQIEEGALFVALRGSNFDGHKFIPEALEKGAVCAISEEYLPYPILKVDNAHKALVDLAKYYKKLFPVKTIAITGSTGKTTVKDMTASVLSTKYKTLKNDGNLNNEIGVPLTVFRLDISHEMAVFELAMRHIGDIRLLADIVRPDIGVITNIGYSHAELLGSRDNILAAKTEIFDFCTDDSIVILNGDDEKLSAVKGKYQTVFFGLGKNNNIRATDIKYGLWGGVFRLHTDNDNIIVRLQTPGAHMVYNALAAAAVGLSLGLDIESVRNGLENFRQSKGRMEITSKDGIVYINDAYNASPASMKAAMDVLEHAPARRICIIGDMLELGEFSREFHREIGVYAAAKGFEIIICVGKRAEDMYKGAVEAAADGQEVLYFSTKEELQPLKNELKKDGDTVLIKASRMMGLDSLII